MFACLNYNFASGKCGFLAGFCFMGGEERIDGNTGIPDTVLNTSTFLTSIQVCASAIMTNLCACAKMVRLVTV